MSEDVREAGHKESRLNVLDINRFKNLQQMGDGSTAIIYRATDTQDGTAKALKLYKPHVEKVLFEKGRRVLIAGQELIIGIRDYEAVVMEILDGIPHIVKLDGITNNYALADGKWVPEEGTHGLVRNYIEGKPLSSSKEVYSDIELLEGLFKQSLDALTQSARRGISLHDIKPEDIIITPEREAWFVDLNLTEPLSQDEEERKYQWNRDIYTLYTRMFPETFDGDGNPEFDRSPLLLRGELSLPNETYEVDPQEMDLIKNFHIRNIPRKIEEGRRRVEHGKAIGLDLTTPEGFLRSCGNHPEYSRELKSLVRWGAQLKQIEAESPSELVEAEAFVDSQLHGVLRMRLERIPTSGVWVPHMLAKLAFSINEKQNKAKP